MNHLSEFWLPILLLALAFSLKLLINKEVSKPHILSAIAELPVDVMFTSSAFIISYRILYSNYVIQTVTSGNKDIIAKLDLNAGYGLFVLYLIITAFVILFWRIGLKCIDTVDWTKYRIFLGLNYVICITALLFAFSKLREVM